jgi:signal transduction histidine kinase
MAHDYNALPVRLHWVFLRAASRHLPAAVALAFAVSALFSIMLTRRLLRPLAQMRAVTARIAAGDFSRRAAAGTRDEISLLAADLNRMADSLERMERQRRDMVADVAHELRTPLASLRVQIEAMLDGVLPSDAANLGAVHSETLRLAGLAEDLLLLSRAEAPNLRLEKRDVNLAASVEQAVGLGRARGAEAAPPDLRLAPDARTVNADPERLAQVLRNLLGNAAAYGVPGGAVTVTSARAGGGVLVEVSNDCSEPPETPPEQLFERFRRGEGSRSRRHGGAGLGLAIVRRLVEAHGGRAGARIEGRRFTVWFTLPG